MSETPEAAKFFKIQNKEGLAAAGEWHQLQLLFPDLAGRSVLDLGCGYGWHCRFCVEKGAKEVLGR